MKEEMSIARRPDVMRTAIKFTLIVGPVLILINHGDMLLSGHITVAIWLKMGLTMIVPYVVSTLSSISACRRCKHTCHDDVLPPSL